MGGGLQLEVLKTQIRHFSGCGLLMNGIFSNIQKSSKLGRRVIFGILRCITYYAPKIQKSVIFKLLKNFLNRIEPIKTYNFTYYNL